LIAAAIGKQGGKPVEACGCFAAFFEDAALLVYLG